MKRKDNNSEPLEAVESELYKSVRSILAKAREKVYVTANTAMVEAYEDDKARQFYYEECIRSKWSVRVLQRQISTHFYDRLIANRPETDVTNEDVHKINFKKWRVAS